MTNQLATTGPQALAFGDRDQVKEIGERLQKMMPGAVRYSESEALTIAQLAVAHGLDPFNGEIWGIKGDNGKWYGVMVGIKGLRKSARRQLADNSGSYWTEFRRVQPEQYDADKSAVVYECIVRDTITTQAWGQSVHALTTSGIPYKDAVDMLGKSPSVTGIGIATPNERSKMAIHARAKKRAEADAIKQAFDVEFAGTTYDPQYIDQEPEYIGSEAQIEEPKRDASQLLADLGYGDEIEDGEFSDEEPEAQIEDPAWDPGNAADLYASVVDSKGDLYSEKDARALGYAYTALNKKIKEIGEPTSEQELSELEELMLKRDAALFYRNQLNEAAS